MKKGAEVSSNLLKNTNYISDITHRNIYAYKYNHDGYYSLFMFFF